MSKFKNIKLLLIEKCLPWGKFHFKLGDRLSCIFHITITQPPSLIVFFHVSFLLAILYEILNAKPLKVINRLAKHFKTCYYRLGILHIKWRKHLPLQILTCFQVILSVLFVILLKRSCRLSGSDFTWKHMSFYDIWTSICCRKSEFKVLSKNRSCVPFSQRGWVVK